LKFRDLVTYVLNVLLLGLASGSWLFVPQSSVVLPSFFVVYIRPFPSFIHYFIISCVIYGFVPFLSSFSFESLAVSNTHILTRIIFTCV